MLDISRSRYKLRNFVFRSKIPHIERNFTYLEFYTKRRKFTEVYKECINNLRVSSDP